MVVVRAGGLKSRRSIGGKRTIRGKRSVRGKRSIRGKSHEGADKNSAAYDVL